jgi:thymidylate kinase
MSDETRKIKLGFIGTHGVGKTTLCYDVASVLKKEGVNVDVVKEVARHSPLPVNRQTSLEAQVWILTTQVAEEIRSASRYDVVVCDRSVLDNYAYLVLACGEVPSLVPFIEHWLTTYDLLFKVPIVGLAAADGFRDTDAEFLHAVDRAVDRLLERWQVPHERLLPEERPLWRDVVQERMTAIGLLQRK